MGCGAISSCTQLRRASREAWADPAPQAQLPPPPPPLPPPALMLPPAEEMEARDAELARRLEERKEFLEKLAGTARLDVWQLFRSSTSWVKADKECVLAAVRNYGHALEHAADNLKQDKEIVLAAVREEGRALQHAADALKEDKEIVLAAVTQAQDHDGGDHVLKFAKGGLNQDPDCLRAAGLIDAEDQVYGRVERATMSVKFSLGDTDTMEIAYASMFQKLLKRDPFLSKFKTFWPNAWCKSYCADDADFTSLNNPCRGTMDTCKFPYETNLKLEDGREEPGENCCWRFGFRFHLQESKNTGGFMIQVEEVGGLGRGQMLETEMAKEVGVKVFRTYTDDSWPPHHPDLGKLGAVVKDWYENNHANLDLENVFIGCHIENAARPKYEKL